MKGTVWLKASALAQMVVCLPLVWLVQGSIPSEVKKFIMKILNLGARKGGDVQLLITVHMLRRHSVLLIAIRSSDRDVKLDCPLGAY